MGIKIIIGRTLYKMCSWIIPLCVSPVTHTRCRPLTSTVVWPLTPDDVIPVLQEEVGQLALSCGRQDITEPLVQCLVVPGDHAGQQHVGPVRAVSIALKRKS